ncbi:AcrR family transcriptional regulator [Caballeronia udeis]|uniref:AcrR family transcriptional regulator n=1 Tax=Caballeronia udeis TaxID=1232866 RepID=A0ABW8MMH9_9BURK
MVTELKRRSQADRTAAARAALVESAITLLSEHGFARTTTAAIAQHAAVTTGALHHHFPTKEGLLIAVLDELAEQALVLFRGLNDRDRHGDGPARSIVRSLWSLYGSRRYWAVWEINLGLRPDENLHQLLIEHRTHTREQMNAVLAANTALKPETKQALHVLLPFLLSAMRGIFLDTFFTGHDSETLDQQLERLQHALDQEIRSLSTNTHSPAPA